MAANLTPRNRSNGKGSEESKPGWLKAKERDIKRVTENNREWTTISKITPEAQAYASLLTSNDYLLKELRLADFTSGKVSIKDLEEFISRSQKIKEEINRLNLDLSKILGKRYTPPRGFAGNQAPVTAAPVAAKKRRKKSKKAEAAQPAEVPQIAAVAPAAAGA